MGDFKNRGKVTGAGFKNRGSVLTGGTFTNRGCTDGTNKTFKNRGQAWFGGVFKNRGQADLSDFGPDLVINGGFDADTDWTKGTGWVISGGVATHTGTTASNLTQAGILTIGKTYRITASLGVSFSVYCGSGTVALTQSGDIELTLTCSGSTDLYFRTASADITIDNVTCRQLGS